MSCNVGHNYLAKIGYSVLKVSKYRTSNHLTDGVYKINGLLKSNFFPSITQQYGRGVHSESRHEGKNETKSDYNHTSSSNYHQQFHRRTYERKRSANDRNEDQQHQIGPLRSEPSINHYQRLNVEHEADLNTIKSAYYSLSKLYHPDVVGLNNQKASENFRLITESYDILSDPKSRKEYDKQLDLVRNSQSSPSNFSWQPGTSDSGKERQPAFHRANADLIFRIKNELAFEQEKKRNPKKFRAGSFRQGEKDELDVAEAKIRMMDRQLSTLDLGISRDEHDFYKLHFRETIRRRREGLASDTHKMGKQLVDANTEVGSLMTVFIVAIALLYTGVNTFFDIDIAADLDSKLKQIQQGDAPPD